MRGQRGAEQTIGTGSRSVLKMAPRPKIYLSVLLGLVMSTGVSQAIGAIPPPKNYFGDSWWPNSTRDGVMPYRALAFLAGARGRPLAPFPEAFDRIFSPIAFKKLKMHDRHQREIYQDLLSIYGPLQPKPPLIVLNDPSPVNLNNLTELCSETWMTNKMYGKRPRPAKVTIFVTISYDLDALEMLL